MLVVELNQSNYEYDVHSMVSSFYPEEQVRVLIPECSQAKRQELQQEVRIRVELGEEGALFAADGEEFRWKAPGEDRHVLAREYKEGFKRFLYQTLSRITGKELPWGSLTGIRPTKIAYAMLEQGAGAQEIESFYREKYFVSQEKAGLSIDIAGREQKLLQSLGNQEEGYSLYLGIPFCPTTCMYCSFTSFPLGLYRKKVDTYVDCLVKEMEQAARLRRGKRLDCVYLGGGTPTTLEPCQLDRLLGELERLFDLGGVKEYTVEAGRADSITPEKLQVLRRRGVGRISVNPQTMQQRTLDLIGRKASVEQVEEAYGLAREMGFDNINMDLIVGLPKEDATDVQRTMEAVQALAPDSLTVHSLAIKRASRLNTMRDTYKDYPIIGTQEIIDMTARYAREMGLEPYYLYRQKNMAGNFENVGYAKPGKACIYNILIMEEQQTIFGCGAGTTTKWVIPGENRIERVETVKNVEQYIDRIDEMIERKRMLFGDE